MKVKLNELSHELQIGSLHIVFCTLTALGIGWIMDARHGTVLTIPHIC